MRDWKLRKLVLQRDRCCQKCCRGPERVGGTEGLHVHHIHALMDGGTDDLENLILLCWACHREWEIVEAGTNIVFSDWLRAPTVVDFIITWKVLEEGKTLSHFPARLRKYSGSLFKMLETIKEHFRDRNSELVEEAA